jgi:hypothetical protein
VTIDGFFGVTADTPALDLLLHLSPAAAVPHTCVPFVHWCLSLSTPLRHSFDRAAPFWFQAYYAEAPVAQVNIPGLTGDFGILPTHVPVLTCLKPGVVSVFAEAGGASVDYFGAFLFVVGPYFWGAFIMISHSIHSAAYFQTQAVHL